MNKAPEEGLPLILRSPAKAAPSGQRFAPALQNASIVAPDLFVKTAHMLYSFWNWSAHCIRYWKHCYCRFRRSNKSENLLYLFFFFDGISQLLLQLSAFLSESPAVLLRLLQLLIHLIQPLSETMTTRLIWFSLLCWHYKIKQYGNALFIWALHLPKLKIYFCACSSLLLPNVLTQKWLIKRQD